MGRTPNKRYAIVDTHNDVTYAEVTNLSRFAKVFRIPYNALKMVVGGYEASVKGWQGVEYVGYTYEKEEDE